MTISAIVGGRDWTDFATNSGYGEFIDWTEELDDSKYEPVIHLADWGWWEGLPQLETSLKSAVAESPPSAPVKKSIDHLLDALDKRDKGDVTVLISNGTGPDDDNEEPTGNEYGTEDDPIPVQIVEIVSRGLTLQHGTKGTPSYGKYHPATAGGGGRTSSARAGSSELGFVASEISPGDTLRIGTGLKSKKNAALIGQEVKVLDITPKGGVHVEFEGKKYWLSARVVGKDVVAKKSGKGKVAVKKKTVKKKPAKKVVKKRAVKKTRGDLKTQLEKDKVLNNVQKKVAGIESPKEKTLQAEIDLLKKQENATWKEYASKKRNYEQENPGQAFHATREGEALRKSASGISAKASDVQIALSRERDSTREKALKALAIPPKDRASLKSRVQSGGFGHQSKTRQANDFVQSITHKDAVKSVEYNSHALRGRGRAYHMTGNDRRSGIHLSKSASVSVYVHETGHRMEDAIPGAQLKANQFRDFRVREAGTPNVNMRRKYGGYRSGETGNEDHFTRVFDGHSAAYVGKRYSRGSTEILSMGLEALHKDPVGFAKKDPEYFKFVVGIMRGRV